MKNEFIDRMKLRGVVFHVGLSEQEITRIRLVYGITFPQELLEFLRSALPVSKGFYHWRDFEEQNVQYIKAVMDRPFQDLYELAEEVDWSPAWGDEPPENERGIYVRKMLGTAPALIPIYGHRYVPAIDQSMSPVFSIHGIDVICYGENLESYLEIEFGDKRQSDICFGSVSNMPFWSGLLG